MDAATTALTMLNYWGKDGCIDPGDSLDDDDDDDGDDDDDDDDGAGHGVVNYDADAYGRATFLQTWSNRILRPLGMLAQR